MNYADLKADMATHAELTGLGDVETADWYNAKVADGPVPLDQLRRVAIQQGVTFSLRKASNNALVTGDLRATVDEALSLFVDGLIDPVDVTHATFAAMVAALKSASIVTDSQESAIMALKANQQTRGNAAGFGRVSPSDVAAANSLP